MVPVLSVLYMVISPSLWEDFPSPLPPFPPSHGYYPGFPIGLGYRPLYGPKVTRTATWGAWGHLWGHLFQPQAWTERKACTCVQ